MRNQSHQKKSQIIAEGTKKTILPFIIHKRPLENSIAYEKKGHWTQKEKLKYVVFLEYFKEKFTSKDKKKRFCRIFKVMSDFIKTRTHNQCRSHHQKMQKQRFQVDSIIKIVASKYHPRVYKEFYSRYLVQVENLKIEDCQEQNQSRGRKHLVKYNYQTSRKQDKTKIKSYRTELRSRDKYQTQLQRRETLKIKIKQEQDQVQLYNFCFDKKKPKKTREIQQSSEEKQFIVQNLQFQFPPLINQVLPQHESLDFLKDQNFVNLKLNTENQAGGICSDYLQGLQIQKLDFINRATYHYNQMQIELRNVAECQQAKITFLNKKTNFDKDNHFSGYRFSSAGWPFTNFSKPC